MPPATIPDLLRQRAAADPDRPQYEVIGPAGTSVLTAGAVHHTARRVAASLAQHHGPGTRAILLAPAPAPFVAAFFGACEAGVVPVPVAPPGRSRLDHGLAPLRAIADDCKPEVILTTGAMRQHIQTALRGDDPLRAVEWVAVEELASGSSAPAGRRDPVGADDVAYLQYTSGSTAAPKGVEVTHGAVLANVANIHRAFENRRSDRAMIWLPLHHDMGLVGGLLATLYSSFPIALATPSQFLQSPARWLRWISDGGATVSGAPDFAYRLCVDRIRDDQLDGIDLSRWRLAFTGAEPVRAETIDAFADRFAPVGFDRDAFYPCYGLAEAALMATGGRASDPPRSVEVSRSSLYHRRVEEPVSDVDTRTVVSCGSAISEEDDVAIVDPDRVRELPENQVGEIWYTGPSMARGYHGRANHSASTFAGSLAGRPAQRWLRTGDLGFLRGGELFVTGRLSETIVIRGRNLDAADVDLAAAEVVTAAGRLGMVAALNPVVDGEECLVVAIEAGRATVRQHPRLTQDVQAELAWRFGVRAHEVILVGLGTLPRTTSGKLKRAAAARAYELGELDAGVRSSA